MTYYNSLVTRLQWQGFRVVGLQYLTVVIESIVRAPGDNQRLISDN